MTTPAGGPDHLAALTESAKRALAQWNTALVKAVEARTQYEGLIGGTREVLRENWNHARDESVQAREVAERSATKVIHVLNRESGMANREAVEALKILISSASAASERLSQAFSQLQTSDTEIKGLYLQFREVREANVRLIRDTDIKSLEHEGFRERLLAASVADQEQMAVLRIYWKKRRDVLFRLEAILKSVSGEDLECARVSHLVDAARDARLRRFALSDELLSPLGVNPLEIEYVDYDLLGEESSGLDE